VRTRVGYTGGEKERPTYHDLGRHTESIQVDYDPSLTSYEELLDVFWQEHRPVSKPWSRQYASFVFVHDDAQRRAAEASKARVEQRWGRRVFTGIRPAATFWRAEDYHQKYRLRSHEPLMEELATRYQDGDAFTDATVTARLNALLARQTTLACLDREAASFDLPDGAWPRLRALANGAR